MNGYPESLQTTGLPSYCLKVGEMSCEHCQQRVEDAAQEVAGVTEARVDLETGTLTVSGGEPAAVMQAVIAAGYPAALRGESGEQRDPEKKAPVLSEKTAAAAPLSAGYTLQVADMHCASCVRKVELAILRLSLYEILHRQDIPLKVAINEAIELAKGFGDENSRAFVNGILDAVARAVDQGRFGDIGKKIDKKIDAKTDMTADKKAATDK